MSLLILGLLLFAGVHLIPSLAPGVKASALTKIGEGGYKGVFSLLLLASFALMIIGWQSAGAHRLYYPVTYFRQPGIALVVIAIGLLVVGSRNSRVRQSIRHPQLMGVFIWSAAHLVMNGDTRAVVLFLGLALWSFVEMRAISKREGDWVKAEIPALGAEVITIIIVAVLVSALLYGHPYFTGVQIIY